MTGRELDFPICVFVLVWVPHLVVLRTYFWFCALGITLVDWGGGPYGVPGIESRLTLAGEAPYLLYYCSLSPPGFGDGDCMRPHTCKFIFYCQATFPVLELRLFILFLREDQMK